MRYGRTYWRRRLFVLDDSPQVMPSDSFRVLTIPSCSLPVLTGPYDPLRVLTIPLGSIHVLTDSLQPFRFFHLPDAFDESAVLGDEAATGRRSPSASLQGAALQGAAPGTPSGSPRLTSTTRVETRGSPSVSADKAAFEIQTSETPPPMSIGGGLMGGVARSDWASPF